MMIKIVKYKMEGREKVVESDTLYEPDSICRRVGKNEVPVYGLCDSFLLKWFVERTGGVSVDIPQDSKELFKIFIMNAKGRTIDSYSY